MNDALTDGYDVVVIGGGPAGLNGALLLARSRRSVLVVDAGSPRNNPAHEVHSLLGHDGTPPSQLLERGRAEVSHYGGQVVHGEVVGAARDGDAFVVTLDDGRTTRARRLLVTTGAVDELPNVAGLRERWGRDVLHCPYCHGWEVRDRAIGILSSGPRSFHQALLFRQLSDDVVYFIHTLPVGDDEAEKLTARDIRIIEGEVAAVEVQGDRLTGVTLRDGQTMQRDAVVISTHLVLRAPFLNELGLQPAEHPSGLGEHLVVEPTGRTTVPGVWAAGNVTDPGAQVGASAAAGAMAGAQINADLVEEETNRALEGSKALGRS